MPEALPCGHHTVFLKRRTQLSKSLHIGAGSGALVRIYKDGGFLCFYLHRNDLILKCACLLGSLALVLAHHSELVQFFSCESPLVADIFGSDSHVVVVERIP